LNLRAKTEEFRKRYGGNIIGLIDLHGAPVSIKVQVDDQIFHIYFSRRWYYNPDGISIPEITLKEGVEDQAIIVMYVINDLVWQYASEWMKLSTTLKNSRNNTIERLIRKEDLLHGPFDLTKKPATMEKFFN